MSVKQFELTESELEIIEGWYYSAAGESATSLSICDKRHITDEALKRYPEMVEAAREELALVRKLGFLLHHADGHCLVRSGEDFGLTDAEKAEALRGTGKA